MNIHTSLCSLVVVSLGSLALAQAAKPDAEKMSKEAHLVAPAAKVLGLEIKTDAKKDLGEIGDLLIDPRSGEIRYAILEVGGFLGVGEDKRIVPWSTIHVSRDEKDADKYIARTSLTEKQVESAPKSKSDQIYDAELDRSIETVFGKDESWAYTGEGAPSFCRLSQMDDAKLMGADGKEVGEIQEFVLAPQNGCVAYAVVDTVEAAGDKEVALPWAKLSFTQDKDNKVSAKTSVDNARLQSAPEFDKKDLKRMSGTPYMTELSTYYACDPFWKTSRFASARKMPKAQK